MQENQSGNFIENPRMSQRARIMRLYTAVPQIQALIRHRHFSRQTPVLITQADRRLQNVIHSLTLPLTIGDFIKSVDSLEIRYMVGKKEYNVSTRKRLIRMRHWSRNSHS